MPRRYYLLILYLLYCNFFNLIFFTILPEQVWTAITLVTLVWISRKYHNRGKLTNLLNTKSVTPIKWIMGCVFFSMVMALIYYRQSFIVSILAYREQYLMFGVLSILIMSPTQKDIINSLKYFALIFTAAYLLKILNPALFIAPKFKSDEVGSIPGYELLCLLLFFYLQKFKESPTIKSFFYFACLLVLIMCMQNRSTIGPVLLACVWCISKIESKWRPILILTIIGMVGIVFLQTKEIWLGLYNQTIDEAGDSNYNRNLAFYYFLFEANKNILTAIFGNGLLSAHTSPLMAKLMDAGIYNTDVGFIGYYNQFGIIPIIIFITLAIRGMKKKELPLYVHLYGFYILIGGVTIMYFGQDTKIICFIMYYYLLNYYSQKNNIQYVKPPRLTNCN